MGDVKNVHNLAHGVNYVGDYVIRIQQDEDNESPREWGDSLGTMVCFHRSYNLGDRDGHREILSDLESSPKCDDLWELDFDTSPGALVTYAEKCGFLVLPLYLYDHSGITMSTGSFSCPWDSGQVGFIYTTPERILEEFGHENDSDKRLEMAKALLEIEVDTYDMFIRGSVYYVGIEDDRSNHVEGCGGIYGLDSAVDYAEEMIEYLESHPPNTVLTDTEAKAFARIIELNRILWAKDAEIGEFFPRERVVEDEAKKLGIRVDPLDRMFTEDI